MKVAKTDDTQVRVVTNYLNLHDTNLTKYSRVLVVNPGIECVDCRVHNPIRLHNMQRDLLLCTRLNVSHTQDANRRGTNVLWLDSNDALSTAEVIEKVGEEVVVSYSECNPGFRLEGLRKTKKNRLRQPMRAGMA